MPTFPNDNVQAFDEMNTSVRYPIPPEQTMETRGYHSRRHQEIIDYVMNQSVISSSRPISVSGGYHDQVEKKMEKILLYFKTLIYAVSPQREDSGKLVLPEDNKLESTILYVILELNRMGLTGVPINLLERLIKERE